MTPTLLRRLLLVAFTSGLLAACGPSADQAPACLAALQATGIAAALIGTVEAQPGLRLA